MLSSSSINHAPSGSTPTTVVYTPINLYLPFLPCTCLLTVSCLPSDCLFFLSYFLLSSASCTSSYCLFLSYLPIWLLVCTPLYLFLYVFLYFHLSSCFYFCFSLSSSFLSIELTACFHLTFLTSTWQLVFFTLLSLFFQVSFTSILQLVFTLLS